MRGIAFRRFFVGFGIDGLEELQRGALISIRSELRTLV